MIGLEDYKKALGKVSDVLSEEEIIKAQRIQDDLAELFYVMFRENLEIKRKEIEAQCHTLTKKETVSSTAV